MKITTILSFLMLVAVLAFAGGASAQTVGTMPVLYNASGQTVNTSGGTLPSGTYYLATGALDPVTYYGDGTFRYDLLGTFGGSVYNPTGQAGNYTIPAQSLPSVGIPNTGAGGNALSTSIILAFSALAGVLGFLYVTRSSYAGSQQS